MRNYGLNDFNQEECSNLGTNVTFDSNYDPMLLLIRIAILCEEGQILNIVDSKRSEEEDAGKDRDEKP